MLIFGKILIRLQMCMEAYTVPPIDLCELDHRIIESVIKSEKPTAIFQSFYVLLLDFVSMRNDFFFIISLFFLRHVLFVQGNY